MNASERSSARGLVSAMPNGRFARSVPPSTSAQSACARSRRKRSRSCAPSQRIDQARVRPSSMTAMSASAANQRLSGPLNAAIANVLVRIRRRRTGRGPPKASVVCHGNLVIGVMQEAMTAGERTLVDAGDRDAALEHRARLNRAMRDELARSVEELTGRSVGAVVFESLLAPDMAVDVYLL